MKTPDYKLRDFIAMPFVVLAAALNIFALVPTYIALVIGSEATAYQIKRMLPSEATNEPI